MVDAKFTKIKSKIIICNSQLEIKANSLRFPQAIDLVRFAEKIENEKKKK